MSPMVRDVDRPSDDLTAAFRGLPAAVLSDAMARSGAMDNGIQPVVPPMRVAGPAFTVKAYPADNLMCHLALKLARPGDVLVVDAGGYCDAALWGELMSLDAKVRGLAGLVIDGAVRDRLELGELGFPVFARGCVPAGTFKVNQGALNVPIACGGLSVAPGDLIVGDADGVVVVPQDRLEEVLARAQDGLAKEETLRQQIEAGQALFDLLDLGSHFKGDDLDRG